MQEGVYLRPIFSTHFAQPISSDQVGSKVVGAASRRRDKNRLIKVVESWRHTI